MKKYIKLVNIEKLRFSVEIECELPKSVNSEDLITRNRVLRGWTVTEDGSLENGLEVKPKNGNHLYFNKESLLQIKEILSLLRVHRAKVSPNCGLHIHIDAKKFSDSQILEIVKEFIHKQRFFVKQFHIEKHRLESTCKLLPKENLNKLTLKQIYNFRRQTQEWSYSGYNGLLEEKYLALNISHLRKGDYGTLEFRLYSATLNYKELVDRILFTLNFIKDSLQRE